MIKQILNPDIYHGFKKKGPFFEGWYYKITTLGGSTFAFIPGVFITESLKDSFSFIQVFNGDDASLSIIKFPYCAFHAASKTFDILISENNFSSEKMFLNLQDNSVICTGQILISNIQKWSDSILNPGSMGFYNYLSFMQCYSQVCAMSGTLKGSLLINNRVYDFTGGKLYIEKNWGRSFPYSYIWYQCNNFQDKSLSVTCSIGHIPMPLGSFTGFLIGLYLGNKFIKFTTINRSNLTLDFENAAITITAKNSKYTLILKCSYNESTFAKLYAPTGTSMAPIAKETLSAASKLILKDNNTDDIVVESRGDSAGVEFAGDFMSLKASKNK
jgi:hypothetical protein